MYGVTGETRETRRENPISKGDTGGDRGDKRKPWSGLYLPCHPCLSPLNSAVLLGVTPVSPVSYTETWVVPEITNSRDHEAREYMEAVNHLQLVLQPGFAGCPSCSGGAKPC